MFEKVVSPSELINLLHQLKKSYFSGRLLLTIDRFISSSLYIRDGNVLWLMGGVNFQERWRRYLESCLPQVTESDLAQMSFAPKEYPEYIILNDLSQNKMIPLQQLIQLITNVIIEGMFDIIQYLETTDSGLMCQTILGDDLAAYNLPAVATEQVTQQIMLTWQGWQQAGLSHISPNLYPAIQNPDLLTFQATPWMYQLIKEFIDGTRTLRLIASKNNQDVLSLSKSMLPLIESGALSFQKLPILRKFNLPELQASEVIVQSSFIALPSESLRDRQNKGLSPVSNGSEPLIVCIDDSESFCQVLQSIMVGNNYRFLAIHEPLRAPGILFKTKPDFIFLDVLMPHFNGYELCSQLRKVSFLKKVPIVFLTSRDGIVDRMKARMLGATGYLSKPVNRVQVLGTIEKYLPKADIRNRSYKESLSQKQLPIAEEVF